MTLGTLVKKVPKIVAYCVHECIYLSVLYGCRSVPVCELVTVMHFVLLFFPGQSGLNGFPGTPGQKGDTGNFGPPGIPGQLCNIYIIGLIHVSQDNGPIFPFLFSVIQHYIN